jgi:hypothetical protein
MCITKSVNTLATTYSINDVVIYTTKREIKCLVFNINKDLKWNNHINILTIKDLKLLCRNVEKILDWFE